ncbi:hypothetical protein [Streptomyces platensis]|uniref:hypothetical protein n=1 Tax=Streptomyces platensis TaxID=58346 RepID=UPI001F3B1FCA|nr:hypothetical protein [Streptomyces platensis]MCF3143750.1 hypothetical protein [Streptomyces platensis]
MKITLWPWKAVRRTELDALREDRNQLLEQRAELQIEVQGLSRDLRDAHAEYERLQEEADTSANTADGLRSRLRIRDEEMAGLKAALVHAQRGESEVYLLQSKGAPINAARSKQGAIKAAEIFGVPPEGWKLSDGTRTDGWTITPIQLVADAPQAIPSQADRK